jgi:hypothetical protein
MQTTGYPQSQVRDRLPGEDYGAQAGAALGQQRTGPELNVLLDRIQRLSTACGLLADKLGSVTYDLLGPTPTEAAQSGADPRAAGSPVFIRSANDAVTDGAAALIRAERCVDRLRASLSPST